ncbi:PH domain-containing protein [Erythrobacter dokdonensis]|uniref:Bacterial membrane flanked domain family n=1 Tax=Erythrobacter dokdonensis DSW-74 TaxID=1300349 RepID=A0A1A7BDQ2_9SPHN|nr:PH domain-containing protein [Erythrobacter dokdonensis]OBV10614.1 Bacterial membrane flanked domain family [Erythrobacter dokdonensis DSW-74]
MDQMIAPSPSGLPVDDEGELTRLHPNYTHALRVRTVLFAIPFLVAALVLEAISRDKALLPPGAIAGPVLLIALALVIRVPARRYNARGYQIAADRLRVVRGILWRSDTVVPFGRVQHIDVDQGPLERFFGIATMTLHTAGNHNASVSLPGLGEELARDMREEIRAHIRRESM